MALNVGVADRKSLYNYGDQVPTDPSLEVENPTSSRPAARPESAYRGPNVGNISGSDLGLTVVKKCVEVHQGAIAIESQLGLGSTFTIYIPLLPKPSR